MISLTINGQVVKVKDNLDMPLLWFLRDEEKLKGTKFGCGIGMCGACSVHVNGQVARACSIPMSALNNADVKTIEGLSADGSHAVQQAWKTIDVPQCGYCQSGQMMAAASLLARNPNPTDEEIDQAMTNICRCGTYTRIRKAIHLAAELATDVG